jgi:hypothetical protein
MDNNGDIRTGLKITDTRFVAFGIVGVIAVFAILILFVGGGAVRHVPITFNEVIQTTVAFRDIGGDKGCRNNWKYSNESYLGVKNWK